MGKPFGKLPADDLRLKSTTDFIQVLEDKIYGDYHISDVQIVNDVEGCSESGGGTLVPQQKSFCKHLNIIKTGNPPLMIIR